MLYLGSVITVYHKLFMALLGWYVISGLVFGVCWVGILCGVVSAYFFNSPAFQGWVLYQGESSL